MENNIIELYGTSERKEMIDAYNYLTKTDYIANKIIEYQFLGKELEQDYTDVLNKREEAREVIRQYEESNKGE